MQSLYWIIKGFALFLFTGYGGWDMNTYFKNVQTLDELTKQYKDLLKKYPPDNGGPEEAAKVINVEYLLSYY